MFKGQHQCYPLGFYLGTFVDVGQACNISLAKTENRILLKIHILTINNRYCALTICALSSIRGRLRYDGGVHLHWNILQRGHLHRLLLLFYVHDKPSTMDLLQ